MCSFDIIFFPHLLCSPDPGTYKLQIRAHAMFNSVYVVAATCGGQRVADRNSPDHYPSYIVGRDGGIIASSEKEEDVVSASLDLGRRWKVRDHGEPGLHDMQWILAKYRRPDIYRKEDPGTQES